MSSLKATKQATHSPSKAEIILSDSQKLSYAPMVALCAKAYGYELENEKLTQLQGKANLEFAMEFVNVIESNKLNYQAYQALKKHTIHSIASAKHITFDSVEKWFNAVIKSYIKNDLANGYQLPKAESKSAKGMSELRSALASIPSEELQAQIEASAKAGDFKKASQLATEKTKREKQAQNAIKKADSKATTELKNALKRFITGADSEVLALMLYAKNNLSTIEKLAKSTK